MKKLLALVLALVMSMSLVTISNAAFKDADKIDYDEAVEVMNAVGVLVGDEKGNFNAKDNLTREQAAKIISYLLLGNKTAAALVGAAKFTDVAATRWSAGFVDYCASTGVVAGNGDGTFAPAGQLTGFQFAKMLLVALGYDAKIEGFTGTDWQINVSKVANQVGLFNGLSISGTAVLTREQAAQMCLNTIKAPLVEYSNKGGSLSVNGAVIEIGASKAQYVTTTLAKEQRISDKKLTNTDTNTKGGYTVEFGEKYYPALELKNDDTDAFGRPTNKWTYDKKDIGTYVNYDLLVSEYTTKVKGGDVYKDIGSNAADYDLTYYVDGEKLDKNDTATQAQQIAKKNDDKMGNSGNGVLTQVFVDTDAEELTITEINTYLAETDDYNEKKETLDFNKIYGYAPAVKTVELDDIASIKDYKECDMVLLTIAKGEVQSIVSAEKVAGAEIDEFSRKDVDAYVKADGDQYDYAVTGKLDDSLGADVLANYDKNNLNDKTFNLYLDTYGYLIGIEQVEDDAEYVFIAAYDRPTSNLTNKTAKANAIFSDGTQKVIEVNVSKSKWNESKNVGEDDQGYSWLAEKGDETENTWYSYTVKNDVYTLKYVSNQFVNNESSNPAVTKIDSKHISQYDGKNYFYGNASTNYITVSLDKVNDSAVIDEVESVATGVKNVSIDVYSADQVKKEAKTDKADSQGVYTLTKTSGAYIIASIVIGDDGATSDKYAYMYGMPKNEKYNKTEDAYYWTMKAVVDGAETVITFKSDLPYDDSFSEGLYKVSYNKDGYAVDAVEAVHATTGKDYQWVDEFDPDDTKLIKTTFGTTNQPAADLTAKGDTLWITQQNIERGFALADKCPAVIIEQNAKTGAADKIVEYTTVEKAIKNLDNYDKNSVENFDGIIIMTVKDGLVTSVILTDTVEKDDHKNNNVGDLTVGVVKVDTTNKKVVLDKDDKPEDGRAWTEAEKAAINASVKAALIEAGYEATGDMTYGPDVIMAVNTNSSNAKEFTFSVVWG